MEKFRELGLSEVTLDALAKKGFEEPSPIQAQTIPLLLKGLKDIVGQAQTGTGKTAAFGLPLVELLDENKKYVQALVLAPTRELAIQVAEEMSSYKGTKRLQMLPIYGGQSYDIQIRGLKRGAQIVVGTPGRIRDHIEKRTLDLSHVTHVVLDEADEMLNMGFQEEVEEILKSVPAERRMLLFSATMPQEILRLAKRYMKDYDLVEVKKETLTTPLTDQLYFEVRDSERFEALCRIIDVEAEFYGIIFCRTKVETDEVTRHLVERGYEAEAIHGDITQSQREKILRAFKAKKTRILVATDVAARGIDVNDLTHVVNYHLPQDPEAYVHRIGRTGRAGKEGTAVTFISPSELRSLLFIQKVAKAKIRKETLPDAKAVVDTKRERLKVEIRALLENPNFGSYATLAQDFLSEGTSAEQLVAAMLQYTFKDELKEESYRSLQEFNGSVDAKGTTRLFVAKGKMDGIKAPEDLLRFLQSEGNVDTKNIREVQIFDSFSFVSAPFLEGEQLLAAFSSRDRKPLITKAKDRDGGGRGGSRGGGFRESSYRGPREGGGGGGGFKGRSDRGGFGRGERVDRPERTERSDDRTDRPARPERSDRPARPERTDRPVSAERSDKPGNFEPKERKPFVKRENGSDFIPAEKRKRENKNVDYLDKPVFDKPVAKKKPSSDTDASFNVSNDDLAW